MDFSGHFFQKENHLLFILLILITIKEINTQTNGYSKALTLANNNRYIINANEIIFCNNNNTCTTKYTFLDDQKLNSEKEIDMISFGNYVDIPTFYLIVANHYTHAVNINGDYYCYTFLEEIRGNQVFLGIPFKCDSSYCYYIIGTLDNSDKLNLYLIANVAQQCQCQIADKIEIEGDSYNFNCHLLDCSTSDVKIICFSQNNASKKILSSNYIINLSSQKIIKASTKSADNNGGQIIKSYLSNDGSTALVCAFDEENNYDCKKFDINNNNWINNNDIVLDNCMNRLSSLNLDKINNSNEYYLYCLQSSNKLKTIKLNSNFEIINSEENGVYSLNEAVANDCNQYSLISLVKNDNGNIDYIIFCDTKILKYQIEKISDFSTTII